MLAHLVNTNGSDLHVGSGTPPRVRVDSDLKPIPFPPVTHEDIAAMLKQILPVDRLAEFDKTGEADFSVFIEGVGRFRGNACRQRGTAAVVLRRVLPNAATAGQLGLPPVVTKLAEEHRGLILVTGPTGSGKTTTLAAMIDHINSTRACKVVTMEDPIEVVHSDKRSIIWQREIGTDTENYVQAMRRVLRQDPDVILIGEMRDAETVEAALSAAETGHLVLSTLHTTNATETINRVIDFFPSYQQHQVRLTLAGALKGVISQRLVPLADGRGRVAAIEAMVVTGRIADRIVDPDSPGETIEEQIANGDYHGMRTFDQSLLELLAQGRITLQTAMSAASNRHDLAVALQTAGVLRPVRPGEGTEVSPVGRGPVAPAGPAPAPGRPTVAAVGGPAAAAAPAAGRPVGQG
ncbi:MAG TPA: PilT/PilU family type 4a pilus ATPase [Acidimicrobiales bacterium]|nr:PilT/PilU family type 4a pilus ATPase [Acidimicrobiales bacterium]